MKKIFLLAVCLTVMVGCVTTAGNHSQKQYRDGRFFAMNISHDARGEPVEKRLRWAKQAGYTGQHELRIENVAKVIEAYDSENMRLSAVYISADLVENNLPENLDAAFEAIKGHKPLIWLTFSGAEPSTTNFDDKVVAIVQKVADLAAKYDMQVALYPHFKFYTEKIQDVLRIAKKANRKNIGVTFNLCHFLKVENGIEWKKALKQSGENLFAVTICGADVDGEDWSALIQPLDKGTFNVAELLAYLDEIKFTGLIGVQDYGVTGDPAETLKRSFNAYQEMIIQRKGD